MHCWTRRHRWIALVWLPLLANACPTPDGRRPVGPVAGADPAAGAAVAEPGAGDPAEGAVPDAPPGTAEPAEPAYGFEDPIVAIDAGDLHTCALSSAGLLFCWGVLECDRQVWTYDQTELLEGPTTAFATNGSLICTIQSDGRPACLGRMPGAANMCREFPKSIVLETSASAIRVGTYADSPALCAETADGSVWCFESALLDAREPACGQKRARGSKAGPNFCPPAPAPVVVWIPAPLHAVAVDDFRACGIDPEGTAHCWRVGASPGGYVGDAAGEPDAGQVVAVQPLGDGLCVITVDGELRCRPRGREGRRTPAFGPVAGFEGAARQLDAQHGDVCAVSADGRVFCWGSDKDEFRAQEVVGFEAPATAVAVGGMHGCALLTTGHVACWGENMLGQFGTDQPASSMTPVRVPMLGPRH